MAESGLSLTRNDLRNAAAFLFGGGVDYTALAATELTIIDRCIDSALRSVYDPTPLEGEMLSHQWSFMRPEMTISIGPAVPSVVLPDDFGGFEGSIYLSTDDMGWLPLKLTGIGEILATRQAEGGEVSVSGAPRLLAVQPLPTDGTQGQRFSLEFWPSADSVYTLKAVYRSNPYQLSSTAVYPLGGMPMAETLREAVLAAVERDVNDTIGVHSQLFKERLKASVNLDRRMSSPKSFGMNLDGPKQEHHPEFWRRGYVLYNNELGD